MSLFEEIINTEQCQKLLKDIPKDEQPIVIDSLKKFVDMFESNVLEPLEKGFQNATTEN